MKSIKICTPFSLQVSDMLAFFMAILAVFVTIHMLKNPLPGLNCSI